MALSSQLVVVVRRTCTWRRVHHEGHHSALGKHFNIYYYSLYVFGWFQLVVLPELNSNTLLFSCVARGQVKPICWFWLLVYLSEYIQSEKTVTSIGGRARNFQFCWHKF